jgi:hypothetical protein
LKNLLHKISKPTIFLLLFCFQVVLFLSLPWNSPLSFTTKNLQGKLDLKLERSNGEVVFRNIDLSTAEQPIEISNQKLLEAKFSNPQNGFAQEYNIQQSLRFSSVTIFSVIFFSFFLTSLLFYLYALVLRIKETPHPQRALSIFSAHLLIMATGLYITFPGFFTTDSFHYFKNAANLKLSSFMGIYFSGFINVLYQLLPYPWILTAANIFIISLFFFHLYLISAQLRVLKYYFLACAVFYLFPFNFFMTFMVSRDTLGHWIFAIFLLEFYWVLATQNKDNSSKVSLTLLAMFSAFFREEVFYILIPGLILFCFLWSKERLRWASATSLILLLFTGIKPLLFEIKAYHRISHYVYETTVLINPLTYILVNKYPEGLPKEVDERLGSYFKNDYLIKYHDNEEIFAFHNGGVNPNPTEENYLQFRKAAMGIFLENPVLFLKNRIQLSVNMMGIKKKSMTPNLFYLSDNLFIKNTKEILVFPDYIRPSWVEFSLSRYLQKLSIPSYFYQSYIIPFLFLFLCLIISRGQGWYWKVLTIIIARSLLVMATAPAGYFKYNYALWLFCLFALPCVIWERKQRMSFKADFPTKIGENIPNL